MTSTADRTGADRLSVRLRDRTQAQHDKARRSGFLDALAAGRLPRTAYADLVAQHFLVYEALEQAADAMAADPVAGVFVFRELTRLPSLTADLQCLHGPDWADRVWASAATVAYCARIREVAFDRPSAFIAHHYTRYLGDLSGGQQTGAAIARAYGFADSGCRFFDFGGLDLSEFKARYRGLLDAVPWRSADEDAFLAEVSRAYELNIGLLDELARRWA